MKTLTINFCFFLLAIGICIYLAARAADRAGIKPKPKAKLKRVVTFFGYDLLSQKEKEIFTAIHTLRCNTALWKGSHWQMIAWNTVTAGDYESFRELCCQLLSEGDAAPVEMARILGEELWDLLLQYRNPTSTFHWRRDDCGGYPEAFEANLGTSL